MPKIATPQVQPQVVHSYADPFVEPEKYEFISTMLELKTSAPKQYRALLGIMRAFAASHPRPASDRRGRAMDARIRAKVRPIDRARAKKLYGAMAEFSPTKGWAVAA